MHPHPLVDARDVQQHLEFGLTLVPQKLQNCFDVGPIHPEGRHAVYGRLQTDDVIRQRIVNLRNHRIDGVGRSADRSALHEIIS